MREIDDRGEIAVMDKGMRLILLFAILVISTIVGVQMVMLV